MVVNAAETLDRFQRALEAQQVEIESMKRRHEALQKEMDTFGARVAACLALERDACSPRDSRKSFSPRFQFLSTKTLAGPRDLAMSPTPVRSPADGSLPPLSLSSRLESVIAPLRTRHHTKMSPVQRVRTHMALGEEGKRPKSRSETRCKDVADGHGLARVLAVWEMASLLIRFAGLLAAVNMDTLTRAIGRAVADLSFAFPVWFPSRIYVIGGSPSVMGSLGALNSAERYDPLTAAWETLAPMHCARRHAAVVATAGFIYAVGGHDGRRALSSVERFDTIGGSWEEMAPLPRPRWGAAAGAIGGKVYVAGGLTGKQSVRTVERFNHCAWETAPALQEPRCFALAVVLGRTLWIIGGTESHGVRSGSMLGTCPSPRDEVHPLPRSLSSTKLHCSAECLLWHSSSWNLEPLPSLLSPRVGAVMARCNHVLISAGGYDHGRLVSSVEGLVGSFDAVSWEALPELGKPRGGAVATSADDAIYVMGGRCGDLASADMERFDALEAQWRTLPSMFTPRDAAAATSCRL